MLVAFASVSQTAIVAGWGSPFPYTNWVTDNGNGTYSVDNTAFNMDTSTDTVYWGIICQE